jgi:ferritin
MLKEAIRQALCEQVNAEYASSYLYLTMSAEADNLGFKGFANWLEKQAKEELEHGDKIFHHILERGATLTFEEIKKPKLNFGSIKAIFEEVYAHEQRVTESINKIATLSVKEADHATYGFLMWFVEEQIEEEASVVDILQKVRAVGDNTALLYSIDAQLSTR